MRICNNTNLPKIIAWSNEAPNYPHHQSAAIQWNEMVLKQDAEDKSKEY